MPLWCAQGRLYLYHVLIFSCSIRLPSIHHVSPNNTPSLWSDSLHFSQVRKQPISLGVEAGTSHVEGRGLLHVCEDDVLFRTLSSCHNCPSKPHCWWVVNNTDTFVGTSLVDVECPFQDEPPWNDQSGFADASVQYGRLGFGGGGWWGAETGQQQRSDADLSTSSRTSLYHCNLGWVGCPLSSTSEASVCCSLSGWSPRDFCAECISLSWGTLDVLWQYEDGRIFGSDSVWFGRHIPVNSSTRNDV